MLNQISTTPAAADVCADLTDATVGSLTVNDGGNNAPSPADSLRISRRTAAALTGIVSEREAMHVDTVRVGARVDSEPTAVLTPSTATREEVTMATVILNPADLRKAQALQGTRGALGGMVAKCALLPQATFAEDGETVIGAYYVDVVAENPAIVESVKRNGDLTYGDDNGDFSLTKLANAVKAAIDAKRKNALAAAADAGTPASFPNVEHVQMDAESTVYIVNWDSAPVQNGDGDA